MNHDTGDLSPAEQRRRCDLIFGDVLPEVTQDERADSGSTTEHGSVDRDEELLREVPPHHG